jgi:hypothetical protein
LFTREALSQIERELEEIAHVAGELTAIEVETGGPTIIGIVDGGAASYAHFSIQKINHRFRRLFAHSVTTLLSNVIT